MMSECNTEQKKYIDIPIILNKGGLVITRWLNKIEESSVLVTNFVINSIGFRE